MAFSLIYTQPPPTRMWPQGVSKPAALSSRIFSSLLTSTRDAQGSGRGLFHFTVVSRFGDSAKNTFTVGSSTPQNTGLAFPGPFYDADVYPTEYFLVQALTPKFSLLLGKLAILDIADQTL